MHKLRPLLSPLRVFDAVRRHGGVVRAAEVLHVTPSAVSQQIKQLESALEVALLRKDGREVELTDAGEQLGLRIADAFDRIERALMDVDTAHGARQLRLKAMPSFTIRWLLPRLAGFYAQYGDIEVVIASTSRARDIHLEQADFVVRHGRGEWTDVEFDHLFDDEFVPVCDAATARGIRGPDDLVNAKLLHSLMRPEAWGLWFASLGLPECGSSSHLKLGNVALCCQAAADGLGVAIAQRAYVGDDLRSGRLVAPINHVVSTQAGYYLVCDPAKAGNATAIAFREWIRSCR